MRGGVRDLFRALELFCITGGDLVMHLAMYNTHTTLITAWTCMITIAPISKIRVRKLYPSIYQWLGIYRLIQNIIEHSAIERSRVPMYAITWMNTEYKVSQRKGKTLKGHRKICVCVCVISKMGKFRERMKLPGCFVEKKKINS